MRGTRGSIHVVAASGPLQTVRHTTSAVFLPSQTNSSSTTSKSTSLAIGGGLDVPLALQSHVSLAPTFRLYYFRRDWAGATASTRALIGLTARAVW
jgi:hypothetical protein